MEDAHQAEIDYWEEIARLNAMAKPFDPGGPFASDAAALNPQARPFDPSEPFVSDAAAVSPFADKLEDSSAISMSSQLSSPNPDDFDYAESVDYVGPPTPDTFDPAVQFTADAPTIDSAGAGPDVAVSSQSFEPAIQFTDAVDDSSLSQPSFEAEDTYQTESLSDAVQFQPDMSERTDPTDYIG